MYSIIMSYLYYNFLSHDINANFVYVENNFIFEYKYFTKVINGNV